MGDYVRELNIELKKLEKEIAETREPMNPEESLEEWERSYNKRKEEKSKKEKNKRKNFHTEFQCFF